MEWGGVGSDSMKLSHRRTDRRRNRETKRNPMVSVPLHGRPVKGVKRVSVWGWGVCYLFYEFRGFAGDFEEGVWVWLEGRNLKYVILITNFDGMLIK